VKPRRYLLIWFSLFLPTIAIGIIALSLLAREQARLDEREDNANRAQAQIIADNANLIMAEIKTGVMLALETVSQNGDAATRLNELTETNPLVETTYIWTPEPTGRFTQTFTSSKNSDAPIFIDLQSPPWGNAPLAKETVTLKRRQVSETSETLSDIPNTYASSYSNSQSKRANIREFTQQNIANLNTLKPEIQSANIGTNIKESIPTPIRNSDWIHNEQSSQQWVGWYQHQTGGPVTGVKLSATTVLEQIQEALPYSAKRTIGYHIEAPYTNILTGSSNPTKQPTQHIPIGTELLGWQLSYTTQSNANSYNLLLMGGGLLIAALCSTSLGSGTLILWRARKDARDSAQKSTFVSNVSHELRTPLTTIRMYAEILEEKRITDPTKQQRYLNTITSESQRLTRLIDNILDFSHLTQGRKHYQFSEVPIIELIQSVIKSQEPRLTRSGMCIEWTAPENASPIESDRDAIEQVLLNLIDNAIKYANTGKLIKIEYIQNPSAVELRISDRGPGIPASDTERIFNTFERLDESLTSDQPGSGLGLSICRGIIQDLGGSLSLNSSLKTGSCFLIKLPSISKNTLS